MNGFTWFRYHDYMRKFPEQRKIRKAKCTIVKGSEEEYGFLW